MSWSTKVFSLMLCVQCCLPLTVSASKHDRLVELASNAYQFNNVFSQEKVFLFFDNTAYFQGETIWFKAYVTDATTLNRAQSGVLYVELVSPTGAVLQQKKLKIVAGQTHGDFVLKDVGTSQARDYRGVIDYPSGYYEVRAYTKNMLNFDSNTIFSRVFPVYTDPIAKGEFYMSRVLERTPNTTAKRPDPDKLKEMNITFYPEGGNLVKGVKQRIAFKAFDKEGYDLDSCIVLDRNGKVLATARHDGMGCFDYYPNSNDSKIQVKAGENARPVTFSLPTATDGYTIRLEQPQFHRLEADILYSNSRSHESETDTIGIAVCCRGGIVYFDELAVSLESDRTLFSTHIDVATDLWPVGVCQMILYDENGRILSTRMFFHSNPGFSTPQITVKQDKYFYEPFDPVNLEFTLKDTKGLPFKDRFAVSVRDADDYGNGSTDNLLSNLLLSSELKGFIRNPEYYFKSLDAEHLMNLDLLMMVQGWQRYDWKVMSGVEPFKETQRLEEGLTINGWVKTKVSRKDMDQVTVGAGLTPVDKTKSARFQTITDSTGYFGFDLPDFEGKARFTLRLTSRKHKDLEARIMLDRGVIPDPRPYSLSEKLLISEQNQRKLSLNANQLYDPVADKIIGYLLPEVEILEKRQFVDYDTFQAFDAEAEVEIELDRGEYTTNVQNFLMDQGYVVTDASASSVMGSGDDMSSAFALSISINERASFWYVHDSEKTRYTGKQYPPTLIPMELVKSVIVFDQPMPMRRAYKFMPLLEEAGYRQITSPENWLQFRGEGDNAARLYYIVDLQLKDQYEIKVSDYYNKLGKRVANVEGYSTIIDFYGPEYATKPMQGTADFRRTLYWNPNVVTDSLGKASVSFYNNSYSKKMIVTGAGITSGGTPYVFDSAL